MRTYLVGGAVRDALLGLPVGEHDWLVTGSTPDEMLSRGYTGAPRTLTNAKIRGLDWFWIAFTLLVAIILLGGDRLVS